MVPTNKEIDEVAPHRSFKIKANFGTLRIGFVEPSIWKTWRKSGRINADAERFMVSRLSIRFYLTSAHNCAWRGFTACYVQGFVLC
jgi:hypothetical protein